MRSVWKFLSDSMRFHLPFAALIAATGVFPLAADELIWQLGIADGSEREFHPAYNAWEYGNAPEIQNSPAMDHRTHTFHYEIETNGLINAPSVVGGLATEHMRHWMREDEIVSGLQLTWNENTPGNRLLTLNVVNWSNPAAGRDGIEISLPQGGIKVLNLPDGRGNEGEPLPLEVVFPVRNGRNTLTIRIVSPTKHYQMKFDNIALSTTDREPDALPPLLRSEFNAPDGIYHPGEAVKLSLRTENFPSGVLRYAVKDAFGKPVAEGSAEITRSAAGIALPSSTRGWFGVEFQLGERKFHTSYVVIEPVTAEFLPDSRFGCHALETDGYQLRTWPERVNRDVRRAFLGGAKWLRHHSIHWFLREPEKGRFDWSYFDDRLAVAEKYKMNVMVTLGGTPKWASASDNMKMTVCGTYYYQNHPPKEWKDWADFVTAVVSRYHGRINWYELWNEPGPVSAFWTNGSPEDFAMLLKTGYEAAKKVDPDCVILPGAPLNPGFLEEVVKSSGGKCWFDVMSVHYCGNGNRDGGRLNNWKRLLNSLGGSEIPIVNTEEMGWNRSDDPLDFPASLLKLHIREAARGIRKTFVFDFFMNGSQFGVSAFDDDGNPLVQYAAYRTMTHRLEHAEFVADLSTADMEIYLFDRRGVPVLVFWSDANAALNLPFGAASGTRINLMDEEFPFVTADGSLKLESSTLPVFVEGGDLKLLSSYGRLMNALPSRLTLKPGEEMTADLELSEEEVARLQLILPEEWTGSVSCRKLQLSAPADAADGFYDFAVTGTLAGHAFTVPLLADLSSLPPGANQVENGDFEQGAAFFFFPEDKNKFDVAEQGGVAGSNALRTRGTVFFGCAGGIKVRPNETYAVIVEARGEGSFGGVYSIEDRNGKTLYPPQPGINCLQNRVDSHWRTFSDEITITPPEGATLHFAILANYGDEDDREIYFNRIAIIRLTEQLTRSRALWQGVCVKSAGLPADWSRIPPMMVNSAGEVVTSAETKWNGPDDLSATCRMAMDGEYLHLRFSIRDDVHRPPEPGEEQTWEYDSIQIAFDPPMNGRERTEIAICRDGAGRCAAYKLNSFWTPELPENLTRRGVMPDVKISTEEAAGEIDYTVSIPLRELYPLTNQFHEFGFSWLVNDNDGDGRKYIQWSGGIGPNKDVSLFGMVKCIEENR